MTSFTSKRREKEDEKDASSHRFRKEARSCTLAEDTISGSIFLNATVKTEFDEK
jgi:hypothetical protein